MKRLLTRIALLITLIAFTSISFNSCMGRFALAKKVYNFNDTITGNKYINNIIFWVIGLWLCGVSLAIDLFILNTIEFWTGSNPVAMNEHESETKIVQNEFGKFQITASKNQLKIVDLNSKNGETRILKYQPDKKAWFLTGDGNNRKIAQVMNQNGNEALFLISPNGYKLQVN